MVGIKISVIFFVIILALVFGRTEFIVENNPCTNIDEIPCDNGQCISSFDWCDRYSTMDCDDGSDEKYCQSGVNYNCTEKHFACDDGRCIPLALRCNFGHDCDKGEDEKNCVYRIKTHSCTDKHFACDDGRCIPLASRCNLSIDCVNGEDEKNCEYHTKTCHHLIDLNNASDTTEVTSPNYPNVYPNNYYCTWTFQTFPGDLIKLEFSDFATEAGSCSYDYVTLYDGNTTSDPLLGKFCGILTPFTVKSTSHKMFMEFRTDGSNQYTGFKATYSTEFDFEARDAKQNLTRHFLKIRDQQRSIYKWGTHLTRVAVALFFTDPQYFAPGNKAGEEIQYELSLQLLSKLASKKKIPTNDLALFINALTVACIDPKDIFGVNMVDELRKRVSNSNHTNPFSILTLCNANDSMTVNDILMLQRQFYNPFRPSWTDTQAMAVMALSCISSRSDANLFKNILEDMVSNLKRKQHPNGTIGNLKTTALVAQALVASRSYRTDFDFRALIRYIRDEVGRTYPSIEDTHYILPIFNSMSFANITSDHCKTYVKTELDVPGNKHDERIQDARIQAQVSLIIEGNADFSRTWKIKVPSNYSFYQLLEDIAAVEPHKFEYSVLGGKPYIVGISKFYDDPEKGMFWFIYTKPLSSTEEPRMIKQSPIDIQVTETDELILWYRSGFSASTQKDSTGRLMQGINKADILPLNSL